MINDEIDILFTDDSLEDMQRIVHQTAIDHGFWDNKTILDIPEKLCLIHSEISEALEEYRAGHSPDEVYYPSATSGYVDPDTGQYCDWKLGEEPSWKPEGFGVELADAVIRILDLCAFLEIDLAKLVAEKHNYNLNREFLHGKKF